MKSGIAYTGVPTNEELMNCQGMPTKERVKLGSVAVIECIQCIPCNPCEKACPVGAISLGGCIANTPKLDEDKCVGCGNCITKCPGLAITVINKTYSDKESTLAFPFEYLPLPAVGDSVEAVDREGKFICNAKVLSVDVKQENDRTAVLQIAFPSEYADKVKSIARL